MVGTFYRSPSPGQPAFVDEGDRVEVGQTLCILEAMKLFNEFKSEHAGVIRRILVDNAQPVEYGQPLFELEPVADAWHSGVLKRVLIANRGEAAVRIVRACHDLGIEAVAVYSTADRDGLWVRLADRAVCVGPHQPAESYLNVANLIAAAETTGCDAVHPGWGFLAENAAFVRACADNDLVFVGPPAGVDGGDGRQEPRPRGDAAAGVPLVPGSLDRLHGADHARSIAAEIGYPVLLKAVGRRRRPGYAARDRPGRHRGRVRRGVGRGAGLVRRRRHVPREGRGRSPPRRDAGAGRRQGGVLVLGERDCSVQRRHQKLIEEGPSPALDEATRARWPTPRRSPAPAAATATPAPSSSCSTPRAASTSSR